MHAEEVLTMARPVLRIDRSTHTRLPSLTDALLREPPQSLEATIEDVETGEILAQPDPHRRVWVCTAAGRVRVSREVHKGDRSAA